MRSVAIRAWHARAAAALIFLTAPWFVRVVTHTQRASWQRRHLGMAGRVKGVGSEPLRPALLRSVEKNDQAGDKLGCLNLLG